MNLKLVFMFLIFVPFAVKANGPYKTDIERNGDALKIVVPASALAMTFIYEDDREGTKQFFKSFVASQIITTALKRAVPKERPIGTCCNSFASGHTSAAFMGAAFIHERYGWEKSVPAYIGAAYVGYSRVEGKKHDPEDVIIGATVGILSSFYFTEEYEGMQITPYASKESVGIQFRYEF